jgi:hypothetical protein
VAGLEEGQALGPAVDLTPLLSPQFTQ